MRWRLPSTGATRGNATVAAVYREASVRAAFGDTKKLRAAVDQSMASEQTRLHDRAEVAFFPPVTGG